MEWHQFFEQKDLLENSFKKTIKLIDENSDIINAKSELDKSKIILSRISDEVEDSEIQKCFLVDLQIMWEHLSKSIESKKKQ